MKKSHMVCIISLFSLFLLVSSGCSIIQKTSVDDYMKLDAPLPHGALTAFPLEIQKENTERYYYYCSSTLFYDDQAVLLVENYSPEQFNDEIKRFESTAEYNEGLFCYPAYIFDYTKDTYYEYALVDKDSNTIIYVYAQYSGGCAQVPEQWRPVEFDSD